MRKVWLKIVYNLVSTSVCMQNTVLMLQFSNVAILFQKEVVHGGLYTNFENARSILCGIQYGGGEKECGKHFLNGESFFCF